MKVRNSLKALMKRHRDNQMVSPPWSRLHHQQDPEALQGSPGLSSAHRRVCQSALAGAFRVFVKLAAPRQS